VPFVPLASGAPALKETKDTHTQRETVSFVALSEGANIDEIKEPEQRLAQRSNVGKRYFSAPALARKQRRNHRFSSC
jgi:hypothetical protein